MTWIDDGVSITTEVAITGEVIEGYLDKNIVIAPGGPQLVPNGWVPIKNSVVVGALPTEVAWATGGNGITSVYGASQAVITSQDVYGARWTENIDDLHNYSVQFRVRVRAGNVSGIRDVKMRYLNASNVQVGNTISLGRIVTTDTSWLEVQSFMVGAPATTAKIQVDMMFGPETTTGPVGWGADFYDVWLNVHEKAIPTFEWRDISCDVRSMNIRYGREKFTDRYEVASCTMELENKTGQYTYQNPHPFGLRPGRQVRVTATYKAVGGPITTYPLYYGIIDSMNDGYSIDGKAVAFWQVLDPTSLFANVTCPTINAPSNTKSGERINRLLDAAGYRPRTIDAGQWYVQEITGNQRSIRDEMGLTADSEGGNVFADRVGKVIYKDRTWMTSDLNLTEVTAQLLAQPKGVATPGDGYVTQAGAPRICGNALVADWSKTRVVNYLELQNVGGNPEYFQDKASQIQYGIQAMSRTDLILIEELSDSEHWLDTRAIDIMNGYKEPILRVNRFSYHPSRRRDLIDNWPWTLKAFLNWRVRVWYRHPVLFWGYSVITHIQSIEHRISPHDWEVSLALDKPRQFRSYKEEGWDYDKWDVDTWDSTVPSP